MFAAEGIEIYLKALDAQLGQVGVGRLELVVCGGSALNALGLLSRVTKDIDVLAILLPGRANPKLVKVEFGPNVVEAINRVARDFSLPDHWINDGPASLLESGLPEGFIARLVSKQYGEHLTVHYTSRIDLIHLKLYAAVDTGGTHLDDLEKLNPSEEEVEAAALWCLTQDVSDAFREELEKLLRFIGYGKAANGFQK